MNDPPGSGSSSRPLTQQGTPALRASLGYASLPCVSKLSASLLVAYLEAGRAAGSRTIAQASVTPPKPGPPAGEESPAPSHRRCPLPAPALPPFLPQQSWQQANSL